MVRSRAANQSDTSSWPTTSSSQRRSSSGASRAVSSARRSSGTGSPNAAGETLQARRAAPPPADSEAQGASPGPSCVRSRTWPGPGSKRNSGALWRQRAKTHGTRMVGVAPPARPAPPAKVRELGAAGRAVARRCEARAEGHRRGRRHRLEAVSAHVHHRVAKTPTTGETRPRAHSRKARSAGKRPPVLATPPRSVDAPFVELHDRHSTAELPMSNGAPPAASGTT